MSRKLSLTGKEAKKYLKRFPNTPILTLAKKMYKENPELFTGVEHARSSLSLHAGLSGSRLRGEMKDKSLFRPKKYNYNPFAVAPLSDVKNVFRMPKSIKKVLLLSDIHIPFHDLDALNTAIEYGIENDVDAVYLNGDTLDMYACSFHEKDPRKVSIKDELDQCREFLAHLRKEFPGKPIYWIDGNHEYRLQRYLRVKAPELLDVEEFQLPILLRFGEHHITEVPYGSKVYFGKLMVEHGDKMRGSGGVNPARTLLLKFKRPTICGHFHRTSQVNQNVYDGDAMMAWSSGCLCELEADYMPVNEWNHGFAIIELLDKDNFRVHNHIIIDKTVF